MHRSNEQRFKQSSEARFLTSSIQKLTSKLPMFTDKGKMSLTLTASRFTVYIGGCLIDLMDSFQLRGSKSLKIKLGQWPVLAELAKVDVALDYTPTECVCNRSTCERTMPYQVDPLCSVRPSSRAPFQALIHSVFSQSWLHPSLIRYSTT